jgi:3'(2'), 5'-bisphosphate nucleotidase
MFLATQMPRLRLSDRRGAPVLEARNEFGWVCTVRLVWTQADHLTARRVAHDAGALLLSLRAGLADGVGSDPDALRAAGDRRSHELIIERLAEAHPNDAVLSEEAPSGPERLDAPRVWIVDPLDGTREFGEADRSDWAVHVALVAEGRLVAGAVALPALGMTLATDRPPELEGHAPEWPRIVVSRTRPAQTATKLADKLDGKLVPMGSAGAKAMAVIRNEADVYVHDGGQYEWDSAAPVAVAAAAGLHVSRLDGSPLAYNQPDPWLPDLLICRPELVGSVRAALGD